MVSSLSDVLSYRGCCNSPSSRKSPAIASPPQSARTVRHISLSYGATRLWKIPSVQLPLSYSITLSFGISLISPSLHEWCLPTRVFQLKSFEFVVHLKSCSPEEPLCRLELRAWQSSSSAKRAGHLVSPIVSAQGCLGLFWVCNTNTPLINQLLTLSCNTSALTPRQLFLWPHYCSPKRLQIPKEFWLCSVTPANGFPLCLKASLESDLWEKLSHPGTRGAFAHSKCE